MDIINKAIRILDKKYNIKTCDTAIVVGSGLLDGTPELDNPTIVSYEKLGLPKSKVKGHSGNFIFGTFHGKRVVLVSRMHYYESGDINKVRLPLEICSFLGVKTVVLLTSSGGLNKSFKVGDIMLINDQINFSGINPLIGIENLKFTNMTDCYNSELRQLVRQCVKENDIDMREGIFVQTSGPSYETNAEVEMLRKMGADAVSMSTAMDSIIANYLNMKVIGFSVIVNVFSGEQVELNHEEVLENGAKACKKLKTIISQIL